MGHEFLQPDSNNDVNENIENSFQSNKTAEIVEKLNNKRQNPTEDALLDILAGYLDSIGDTRSRNRETTKDLVQQLGEEAKTDPNAFTTLVLFSVSHTQEERVAGKKKGGGNLFEREIQRHAAKQLEQLAYDDQDLKSGIVTVRKEWPVMVDSAVTTFPSLKGLEYIVSKSGFVDIRRLYAPDMLKKIWRSKFIDALQDEKLAPDYLKTIASGMPEEKHIDEGMGILQSFVEQGLMTQDQLFQIDEARKVVFEMLFANDSPDFFRSNSSFFTYLNRDMLNAKRFLEMGSFSEDNFFYKKYGPEKIISLAGKLLQCKDRPDLLQIVTRKPLITHLYQYDLTIDDVEQISTSAPGLLEVRKSSLLGKILEMPSLIRNVDHLQFVNNLSQLYGSTAEHLVDDYIKCVNRHIITPVNKDLVLEFLSQFRSLNPDLIEEYLNAKQTNSEHLLIAELKELARKMVSGIGLTDEERNKPYFKGLLRHVYPNNSGGWGSYTSAESCGDRSQDLNKFKVQPRYDIDLLAAGEIKLKEGQGADNTVREKTEEPIMSFFRRTIEGGVTQNDLQQELARELDTLLQPISESTLFSQQDLGSLQSLEDKLYFLLSQSIYGANDVSQDKLKELILKYEFASTSEIQEYVQGTNDRLSAARNKDYALLCELNYFYSDRIRDTLQRVADTAHQNPLISRKLIGNFNRLAEKRKVPDRATEVHDQINRKRLGANRNFVKQIGDVLQKRTGRKYNREQIERVIKMYEGINGGLVDDQSASTNTFTRDFYDRLKRQRDETKQLIEDLTGTTIDPAEFHLTALELDKLFASEEQVDFAEYNEERFKVYTLQQIMELFNEEQTGISKELNKYVSTKGDKRKVLHGYITKSKESAAARMTGGVCVSIDNPLKKRDDYGSSWEFGDDEEGRKKRSMWDMPNFFQLVLQDPETMRCQGLVMMHLLKDGGRNILSLSLNPSSTYLYSVDESALFEGLMTTIEQFALENNIDTLVTPQSKSIRTNRTGGEFEKAIERRIKSTQESISLSKNYTFSYTPRYSIRSVDVLWSKPE